MKQRKNAAILRAVAAVVIAAALMAATGFGAFRLMSEPEIVTQGAELVNGAYVSVDITHVMAVVGVEKNSGGQAKAYYAAVPIGDQFVAVRFPASDSEDMMRLVDATDDYLHGRNDSMPFHLIVTGAVREIDEETSSVLNRWFSENLESMIESGMLLPINNYGNYLSGLVIDTGSVGHVSVGTAVAAAILAAALVIYAVVEFVLVGMGVYAGPRKKDVDG